MGWPHSSAEFRDRLIGDTVRSAARDSAFYRSFYDGLDVGAIVSVDDLFLLPTVDKQMLSAAGNSALCVAEAGPVIAIQNTSGTTGKSFSLYRCERERAFIEEFFVELASRNSDLTQDSPLALQLTSDRHGLPTGIPTKIFPIGLRLMDRSSLDRAVELLGSTFHIAGVESRISMISGGLDDLSMLTGHLIERGIDPRSEFAVRQLSPIGRYLTRRWRALLSKFWGARLIERYSLSEIFGGASWIADFDGYVFDPYVVPEVLALDGTGPLAEGVGRLHLTSLKPFSVLQPFIRYRTGDLFEVRAGPQNIPIYRFLGREAHALFHPRSPELLLANGVTALESLDPHPEFNRDLYPIELGVGDRSATGWPRARGVVEPNGAGFTVRLEVETRCLMALYPVRANELRERIVQDFLSASPALRRCIGQGEAAFEVDFAPTGSLREMERNSGFWRANEYRHS